MQGNCAYFEGLTIELLIEPLIYAYSSLITLISLKKNGHYFALLYQRKLNT